MKVNECSLETIRELIEACGGNSKFAKRFRIPIRSVENWKRGVNNPPEYLLLFLQYAVDHELDFSSASASVTDMRFYPKVLSEEEIKEIYKNQ